MSPARIGRPLVVMVGCFVLATASQCARRTTFTEVPVDAVIDVDARKVTPDPLLLRYDKADGTTDFAHWQLKSPHTETFIVRFKPDPSGNCKNNKPLDPPDCNGNPQKECKTKGVKKEHRGCHKYSVIIWKSDGFIEIDPQVNVDP